MADTERKRKQHQNKDNPQWPLGALPVRLSVVIVRDRLPLANQRAVRNYVWMGRDHSEFLGVSNDYKTQESSKSLASSGQTRRNRIGSRGLVRPAFVNMC